MLKNSLKYFVFLGIIIAVGITVYFNIFIPKHTFKTTKISKKDVEIKIDGLGYVDSENYYNISSIYPGKILNFNLKESSFIQKEDLIADIDYVDLKDKIDELNYQIEKIRNDIEELKIEKKIAVESYKLQKEIFNKNKILYKKKNISKLDFDKINTDTKIAKLKIDTISSKISSLSKQLLQFSSSVNGLNKKLQKYHIVSPVSGFITDKYVSNHQYVNPGQNLITIVKPEDIRLKVFIDTRISGDVKINNKAFIKLRSKNKIVKGYVSSFNLKNNKITYEREIYIKYNNIPKEFFIDEQADVEIYVKKLQNEYVIPYNAVSYYNGKNGIWILKDKKAHFISLKIKNETDNTIIPKEEISNKQFLLNSKIIIPNGKLELKEGMKIYEN